ncbi:MAG: LuxR C-terminal-related transcriptional regulator, partial [Anaerolineales bacterium]|nr:LuxR C-terminal-related transcriptional regulator [Anaerolineales bacterium]
SLNAITLTAGQQEALEARTEGWAAGLQVASLGLSEGAEPSEFITRFTGSDHYLLDYLVDEVLRQQPERIRQFLFSTSILNRFCAPLAAQLLEVSFVDVPPGGGPGQGEELNAAQIIDYLTRANLFVVPMDDEGLWYRYHNLFAGSLEARLREIAPGALPRFHRRAAAWLAENGALEEAVPHALAAQDFPSAARYVEAAAQGLLLQGEFRLLLDWLEALPEEIVRGSPALCIAQAWVFYYLGPLETASSWIQAAEDLVQGRAAAPTDHAHQLMGQIAALRALTASSTGDIPETIRQGEMALQALAGEDRFLRTTVLLAVGLAHRYNGEVSAAIETFEAAYSASYPNGSVQQSIDSLCNIANLQLLNGELKRGAETLEEAFRISAVPIERLTALASEAYILKAVVSYEINEIGPALEHVSRSIALAEKGGLRELQYAGFLWRSYIHQAGGDLKDAWEDMAETERVSRRMGLERISRHVRAAKARLSLASEDLAAAERWAERVRERWDAGEDRLLPIREFEIVTWVQILLAAGKSSAALDLLNPAAVEAQLAGRHAHAHQMNLYRAAAYFDMNDTGAAEDILAQLLPVLAAEGYVRLVLDVGDRARALLEAAVARNIEPRYAQSLLNAPNWPHQAEPGREPDFPVSLSARELEVLALVGAGHSNREIAAELHITTGTVKRHLFNIFRKLDANNRTAAVATARSLGLMG